jgi:phage terminase Nu1 subunit (DNA packaging protein)
VWERIPFSISLYRKGGCALIVYAASGIARTLGISEQEVKALTKTGVIKRGFLKDRGLYLLEPTAKEIIANYRKSEDERENVDYATERAKLMRAKRQNEEYNLMLRKGELYAPEDVKLILAKTLVSFRASLLAIPSRAAPQLAQMNDVSDVSDLISGLIREALEQLSDFDTVFKEGEESEEPAGKHERPVS